MTDRYVEDLTFSSDEWRRWWDTNYTNDTLSYSVTAHRSGNDSTAADTDRQQYHHRHHDDSDDDDIIDITPTKHTYLMMLIRIHPIVTVRPVSHHLYQHTVRYTHEHDHDMNNSSTITNKSTSIKNHSISNTALRALHNDRLQREQSSSSTSSSSTSSKGVVTIHTHTHTRHYHYYYYHYIMIQVADIVLHLHLHLIVM
jgi:hypothetical protein